MTRRLHTLSSALLLAAAAQAAMAQAIGPDSARGNHAGRLAQAMRPIRVDLKTAQVRVPDGQERRITGGSAIGLALDPTRSLQSVTVRALAQDVVIGVIAATLTR